MNIGAHMSVAGGLHLAVVRAAEAGFSSLQIFTHSPRIWKSKPITDEEINLFIRARKKNKIKTVVVHAPYLPNLASSDISILKKSIDTVANDLCTADAINADYYVLHPGSPKGMGIEFGIKTIVNSLSVIFENYIPKITFLIETMPGAGSTLGADFNDIALIISKTQNKFPHVKMGVCLDTAHIFAAGYDIREKKVVDLMLKEIKHSVGVDAIHLIHSNDSRTSCGSKRDHHNHIGKGEIGMIGFENMIRNPLFRKLTWILETPKDEKDCDISNRKKLEKIFNKTAHS